MVYAKRYFSSCCVQQVCCFDNLSGIVPEYWTCLTWLCCKSFIFPFRPQFMLKDVCLCTVSNTSVVLTSCSPTLLRGDEMRNENGCRWSASALRNLFQWAAWAPCAAWAAYAVWAAWAAWATWATRAAQNYCRFEITDAGTPLKQVLLRLWWSLVGDQTHCLNANILCPSECIPCPKHTPSLLWLCVICNGLSRLSTLWPFPRNMWLIAKCRAAIVLVQ